MIETQMQMGNSKPCSKDTSIIDNRNYNHNLGKYRKSNDLFFNPSPVKQDQNLHFQIKELERSNDISRIQMKSMLNIKDDENYILKMKVECLSKELDSIRSSQFSSLEQKLRFKSLKQNKSNTTYTIDDEVKDSCCSSSEDTVQKESVIRLPSRVQYDGEQSMNEQNIYSQLLSFFQRVESNEILRKLCNGCMLNYRSAMGMFNQRRYGDLLVQSLQALNTLVDGLTRIKIDNPEQPKFKPELTHHKQSRSLYVNLGYQDPKYADDQCLSPSFDVTQKNQVQKKNLLNFDLNEFLETDQNVKSPPPFDKNNKMNSISPIREDVSQEIRSDNKSSKIKPSNLKNRNKLMPCQQKSKRTEGSFGIKK